MEEQFTIKQHYITEHILLNFSNHKQQVFEALVNERKIYQSKCRDSMSESYIYEHPALMKNNLEKEFSKIEGDFDSAIKHIIDIIEIYENNDSSIVEIKNLIDSQMIIFIIFYYKSGALLHEFDFLSERKEQKINLLLENLLDSNYIKALSETIINYYKFSIVKSENNDFLISDQYISTAALGIKSRFANISNRHMGLKNAIMLIPISSKYYIAYFEGSKPHYIKENAINQLNDDQIKEMNEIIINNSYIKCVGKNKVALELALSKFEFKSPSTIMGGFDSGAVMGATLKKEIFLYENDLKTWDILTAAYRWSDYGNLKRNDRCSCKSGKKYKNCCKNSYEEATTILRSFGSIGRNYPFTNDYNKFKVNQNSVIEKGIGEFYTKPN